MTFPFSSHNYQLRFWMAAGGVDPDEDVQLVVLPPPYMVGSLASGHVDGFCVGAPWNSVAVEAGTGVILHFGSEILAHALEKVLAVRAGWAEQNTDAVLRLVRACRQAADYIEDDSNHPDVVEMLAAPHRLAVAPDVIRNTLGGRLNVASGGPMRTSNRYVLFARDGAARPDAVQAAWLYAQMVRWRQTPFSLEQLAEAEAVLRPDIYDAAIGKPSVTPSAPSDGIGAFAGPPFDPRDIVAHLSAWTAGKAD
jgi:NitT/TauT family transport system ATP-binding protein